MADQLPEGWKQVGIDALLYPLEDGRTLHQGWSPQCEPRPAQSDAEWGVLKTTAIQDGVFLPEHNKKLPDGLEPRPRIEVKDGDLIMTCAGPRARCGVACLVKNTRPRLMLSGKMYRFRAATDLVNPTYLEAWLRSPKAQGEIDRMKTGISDSGLNLTHARFRRLTVPVAPRQDQDRIVAKIEELFSDLDAGVAALPLSSCSISSSPVARSPLPISRNCTSYSRNIRKWRRPWTSLAPVSRSSC